MRIATNTPFSFSEHPGIEFVQLGDCFKNVDMIILMLEKNWGARSIEAIEAITYWVGLHAKDIPCFLIGAESTIPNEMLHRYKHAARDSAIQNLCKEVLSRSRVVGVRGNITYRHLTELIGLDNDRVETIYSDYSSYVKRFLIANPEIPKVLENDIHKFQAKPYVAYEKPILSDDNIFIKRPYVTEHDGRARLNADVIIDGRELVLWSEVDLEYKDYLLHERSDAFLCVLIPFALRAFKNIICEAPVTESLYHNLVDILLPELVSNDSRLQAVVIKAETDADPLLTGNAVATGMSCGIDSLYTAGLYAKSQYGSLRLTHLYTGNYLYGNDGAVHKRAREVAAGLELPLVETFTNINKDLKIPHLYSHFYKTIFGVLSLRKLFSVYYYSSMGRIANVRIKGNATLDTAAYELLLLYCFSTPELQIVTGGGKSHRIEKTIYVGEMEVARKYLNVCLNSNLDRNCSRCRKCMRTILMLDMVGKLEEFNEVFDLNIYKAEKISFMRFLTAQKNTEMLGRVYRYFRDERGERI